MHEWMKWMKPMSLQKFVFVLYIISVCSVCKVCIFWVREFCKLKNKRLRNIHVFTAVLTGRGNHRQGGDGWKGLDATQKANCKKPDNAAASLGNHQLWWLWKVPRDPKCANAVMIWHLDDWIDILGRMFSFSTLLIEKWEWMEETGWMLMWSGMHHIDRAPPSTAVVDTAGSSHSLDCWGMGLLPVMEKGCLGKEAHFYVLIAQSSGKETYPFLLNTPVCICPKAGFFDFFIQIGHFILSLSIMSI